MGVIVALHVLAVPRLAVAQTQVPVEEDGRALAKRKVLEGQELYEQARYEEALVAFQDAAAAYASPDFQFNIGLCHERLGEPQAAIRAFEAYLRNKPDASDRASVEHRIEQLYAELDARSAPPTPVETAPPSSPVEDAPVEEKPHRPLVVAGSVLLGFGVAAMVGGGIGFGVPAGRRADRVDDVLTLDNPEDLSRAQSEQIAAQGDRFRTLQVASLAVGGALSVAGVVVLARGLQRRARAERLSVLPSPSGVVLVGRF